MGCSSGCTSGCTGRASGSTPSVGPRNTRGCTCGYDCGGGCSRGCESGGSGSGFRPGNGTCWCGTNCSGCGGCSSSCSGCSGDCSGCSGSCGGSCSGTCTGDCKNGCTGSCKTGCQGNCKGECSGSCNTACTNGCGHLCNSTCVSDVAVNAYNYLKTYNEKIDDNKYIYDIHNWHTYTADDHSYIEEDGITAEIFNNSNKEYYYKDGNTYKRATQYEENVQYYLKDNNETIIKTYISHLDKDTIALDWLDRTEINYLLQLLQEEGRRRKLKKIGQFSGGTHPKTKKEKVATTEETLNKSEKIQIGILDENGKVIQINSGDFITDQGKTITMKNINTEQEKNYQTTIGIKELNNLLLTNTGKQIDMSSFEAGIGQNQTIKRKAGEAIIQKALSAWDETIGIASTSDSKGVQTVG